MRKICFFLSLITLLASTVLLITGSSWLVLDLGNGLPLGTITTWLGIVALPCTLFFGFQNLYNPKSLIFKRYRNLLFLLMALSVLWGFIAFLLAGNWSYNFAGREAFRGSVDASRWFWIYTYSVIAEPLLFLLIFTIHTGDIRKKI